MARSEVASDSFTSSIDGSWTQGPGVTDGLSWVSAGVIQPSTTGGTDCMIARNTGTYSADQYSKGVVATGSSASVNNLDIFVRTNTTDCVAYVGLLNTNTAATRWGIFYQNSSDSWTSLASGGTGGAFSSGDYGVLEVVGTQLQLFTSEGGGSETLRLTTTDATISSGRPGIGGWANTTASQVQWSSWSGGDITDTTPDQFSLPGHDNVALSEVRISAPITVSGINAAATISVSGTAGSPEYRKNGGSWVSTSGTVSNGDTVEVRGTASASNGTNVTVVLTIDSVSATFNITTVGTIQRRVSAGFGASAFSAGAFGGPLVQGSVSTANNFSAAFYATAYESSALTTSVRLASTFYGVASLTATLPNQAVLSAALLGNAYQSSDITTSIRIASSINATATEASNLTTSITANAALLGVATQVAAVGTSKLMSSALLSASTQTSQLSTSILLSSQSYASSYVVGTLLTPAALAAGLYASSYMSASATNGIRMATQLQSSSAQTAAASMSAQLSTTLLATAQHTALLGTSIRFSTALGAQSYFTGSVLSSSLAASFYSVGTISVALATSIVMSAPLTSTARLTGALGVILVSAVSANPVMSATMTTSTRLSSTWSGEGAFASALSTAVMLSTQLYARGALVATISKLPPIFDAALTTSARLNAALSTQKLLYVSLSANAAFRAQIRLPVVSDYGATPNAVSFYDRDVGAVIELPGKYEDESYVIGLDLRDLLPSGVTLTAVTAVLVTEAGGAAPDMVEDGLPGIDASGYVALIPLSGGVSGNYYEVEVRCASTNALFAPAIRLVIPVL